MLKKFAWIAGPLYSIPRTSPRTLRQKRHQIQRVRRRSVINSHRIPTTTHIHRISSTIIQRLLCQQHNRKVIWCRLIEFNQKIIVQENLISKVQLKHATQNISMIMLSYITGYIPYKLNYD